MKRPNPIRTAYLAGALSPADLIAFHRRTFGDARMDVGEGQQQQTGAEGQQGAPPAPPERPEGVSEEEWSALGDPGKRAIVRERDRATRAEQEAAALRATRTPKPGPPKKDDDKGRDGGGQGQQQTDPADIATLVQQAVTAAFKPFQEQQTQAAAESRARQVAEAVTTAAGTRLHDASDALAHVDLTTLTDGAGNADPAKITAAIDDLVKRKPHLAKVVDTTRRPGADSMLGGAAAPGASEDDRVKAVLAKMQAATGVRLATADN